MRFKPFLRLFPALLLTVSIGCAHAAADGDLETKLEEYIRSAVEAGFSGAVLVDKGGEVILHAGYGLADRESAVPVTADTVFDIGSITKRFTRAAVLKLEEQGKLERSDTLKKFFEDVPADKADITIDQVLEHRAGFHEYHDTRGDFEKMDRETALKTILGQKLLFEPGEKEAYSNSGYGLLAVLIEKVSGQTYQSFVRENLLKPAGMDRTGFYREPLWKEEEVAVGYEDRTIGEKNSPLHWPEMTWALVGGGGLVAPVGDLYKWIRALENGRILGDRGLENMFGTEKAPMAYAGANDFGFSAVVYEYPADKNCVIVATNSTGNVSAMALGRQLSRILRGEEPEPIRVREEEHRPSNEEGWGLPDSPTGRMAKAILDALSSGDREVVTRFIEEKFSPDFRDAFSMEEHLGIFKQVHDEMGEIELLEAKKTAEFQAELLIQSRESGRRIRISFELEAGAAHLIAGMSIEGEQAPRQSPASRSSGLSKPDQKRLNPGLTAIAENSAAQDPVTDRFPAFRTTDQSHGAPPSR